MNKASRMCVCETQFDRGESTMMFCLPPEFQTQESKFPKGVSKARETFGPIWRGIVALCRTRARKNKF